MFRRLKYLLLSVILFHFFYLNSVHRYALSLSSSFPILRMLVRSFKRRAFVTPSYLRRYYTALGPFTARTSRGLCISAAGGGALTVTLISGWAYSLHADAAPPSMERALIPLHKLFTSYVVYSMCSVPGLVDASPGFLAVCTSIPGLRQLTEAFVRATFFTQVRSHTLPT